MNTTPPHIADAFNNQELVSLVNNHNLPSTPSYLQSISAPDPDQRSTIFDKLAMSAVFLAPNGQQEAYIPVDHFKADEMRTILWMFAYAKIQSKFERAPNTMIYLSVKDTDHQHFIADGKNLPVIAIQEHQQRLSAQRAVDAFLAAAPNPAPVAPENKSPLPFVYPKMDIIVTENKGLYIPVGEMSEEQKRHIALRMREKGISFEPYKSRSEGDVFRVSQTEIESLHRIKSELEVDAKKATERSIPLYIPPFNIQITERRIHIFRDHMHSADENLLAKALESKNIDFIAEESEDYGHVYTIKFKYIHELLQMKKEARTKENRQRVPETARLYPTPPKGAPTINILEKGDKLYIPLDGMTLNQVDELKFRLAPTRLPYEQHDHEDFGHVLSFDSKYINTLDGLSVMLRAEHKRATMAARDSQLSGPVGGTHPA